MDRRGLVLGASQIEALGHPMSALAESAVPDAGLLPAGASSLVETVNGIQLHYVIAGSGPPVVLLHGWPQTWFAWRDTMDALSARFTVIAPDLRGIGLSEKTAEGYDKATIAADVAALIDHAAGGRAAVIGHDMGGKAAYMLAQLSPRHVSRLILVDCLLPGTENTEALRGGAWHYGFHMAPIIPELLTEGQERNYIAAQIRAWSFRKDAISEAAITEYARHYASPGGMTAGFNYYRALRQDADLVATFAGRTLAMPVLAIGGRYGVGTKLADTLREQAVSLSAIVAENSGHFVAEEEPDLFRAEVTRFLQSYAWSTKATDPS